MICQTRRLPLSPGANKGIGFEIARQLGTQGAFTLVGARDETRGREAATALAAQGSRSLRCALT
jgi:NAD(P)-dependent dehydrogenase (short-subunit alcohol dehydrogenase family)